MKCFSFALLCIASLFAAEDLRVQPVARTPEADTIAVVIAYPSPDQVLKSGKVWIQARVDGFALAADSPFDRASEIATTEMGQTLHVVVDNEPYFAVNEEALDPFIDQGFYYDTTYKFEVPGRLGQGAHTLRIFPARSYGESLKGNRTFVAFPFYVGKREGNIPDLSKPYLTYNEPSDRMELTTDQPVLLDFYISNCELTSDGYRVRLSVDGKVTRMLTVWVPYYLYGLSKGKHTIRLELLDRNGKLVDGPFSDVSQTIHVR